MRGYPFQSEVTEMKSGSPPAQHKEQLQGWYCSPIRLKSCKWQHHSQVETVRAKDCCLSWAKTKFLDVRYGTNLKIFGETTSRWTPSAVTMETAMFGAMSRVALWWSGQLMAKNHPVLQTKRWWATWKHKTTLLSNSDKSPLQINIICPMSMLSKAMNYSKSKKPQLQYVTRARLL